MIMKKNNPNIVSQDIIQLRRQQRRKNLFVLSLLCIVIMLIYWITIIKISGGGN